MNSINFYTRNIRIPFHIFNSLNRSAKNDVKCVFKENRY